MMKYEQPIYKLWLKKNVYLWFFFGSWIRRRVDVFNLKMVGVRASEQAILKQ